MSGDGNGWDDPVVLPEDESTIGSTRPAPDPGPAQPPPAYAPAPAPGPAPPPPGGGGGSGPDRRLLIGAGIAIVAIIVVIAVVASGGGSKHHATTGGGSSGGGSAHAAFVADANEICAETNASVQSDIQSGNTPGAASNTLAGEQALSQLTPPAADAAKYTEYLNDLSASAQAATEGDQADFTSKLQAAAAVARQLGLTACAGG